MKKIIVSSLIVLVVMSCNKEKIIDPVAEFFERAFSAVTLPVDAPNSDLLVEGKFNGKPFRLTDGKDNTVSISRIGQIFSSSGPILDPNNTGKSEYRPVFMFWKQNERLYDSLGFMFLVDMYFKTNPTDSTWAQIAQRHFQKTGNIDMTGGKFDSFNRNGITVQLGGKMPSGYSNSIKPSPIAHTSADSLSQDADNFLRLDKIKKTSLGGGIIQYDLTFKFDVWVYRQSENNTMVRAGRITEGVMQTRFLAEE